MAYPTYEDTTPTALSTQQATQPVNHPATVNAGELLVAVVTGFTTSSAPAFPGDWTVLEGPTGATAQSMTVAVKIGAGTEGGTTFNVAMSGAGGRRGSANVVRVSGWFGTISGGVEEGGTAIGNSAAPDATEMTPSWGSAETLWIWYAGASDDDATVDGAPTGYINLVSTNTGSGANASTVTGTATKTATAASDDPGAGSLTASQRWMTGVIAIRPAAAGGGGITLPLLHAILD
jgi:hypothetical protein